MLGNRILLVIVGGWLIASRVTGEYDSAAHEKPSVDLRRLQTDSLANVKRAADQGICSPDFYDAGIALQELIFHHSGELYRSGSPKTVFDRNDGITNYFNEQGRDYPEMSQDKATLIARLHQLDTEFPIEKLGGHGPSLESTSHYDAYGEALKVTKGNVFRAVSLIGNIGHDDVGNFLPGSNLYAPNSIGVTVPNDVVEKFKQAGQRCNDVFDHVDAKACLGAGSSFNYHVNFGFFLGCYFAKKGFGKTTVSKIFADGAVAALNEPYLEKELGEQARTGRLLNQQYQLDVCTDVPKLLGYFYKRTTMSLGLTNDARILFEKGYRRPFLERDKKNPIAKPAEWSAEQWQKAIANLDYRLMHLEYGSKQAEAGAKKGAEVCSNYAAEKIPKGLSPDAELLYKRGNFNPEKTVGTLNRVPEKLKASPEKLTAAWHELATALKAIRPQFDYADSSVGTTDLDRHIEHIVHLRGDKDYGLSYSASLENPYLADNGEVNTQNRTLLSGLEDLSGEDLLAYLRRKEARTPLTNESVEDAQRHGQLLGWAATKNPTLQKQMAEFLSDGNSDFLKYVSLTAAKGLFPDRELATNAARLMVNATEPLLSEAINIIVESKISPDTAKIFASRLGSINPRNLSDFSAKFLLAAPKEIRSELVINLINGYEKLPEYRRNEMLRMMRAHPSTIEMARPDLLRLKNGNDSKLAHFAGNLLSELNIQDVFAEKK